MGILGGIGDILFGESPSADITPVTKLGPEQLKILRETLAPFIEGLNLDPGATDLGPASELSLEALEQRALSLVQPEGGQTSSQKAIGGILEGGVGADFSGATESGLAAFTDPAQFNELFDAGVTDPAIQALNERILPNISRRFAPSGFFGSERIESDRRALEDVIDVTGEQRATQFLDRSLGASVELERSRRADLDRFLQRAGLDTEARLAAVGAGGVEGVDLEAISSILQSDEFGRLAELDKINVVLAALGLPTQENIAAVKGGSSGLLGSFLGGAGGGAAGKALFGG